MHLFQLAPGSQRSAEKSHSLSNVSQLNTLSKHNQQDNVEYWISFQALSSVQASGRLPQRWAEVGVSQGWDETASWTRKATRLSRILGADVNTHSSNPLIIHVLLDITFQLMIIGYETSLCPISYWGFFLFSHRAVSSEILCHLSAF